MPDLTLSTEKSLHRPLTVNVDGKEYALEKITKILFDKLIEMENSGDHDAGYKQVELAFKIPIKTLEKLDSRDVKLITKLLTGAMTNSEQYLDDAAKNVPGPGKTN